MSEFWDITENISKIEPLKPSRIQWLEEHFTPRIQCHLAIYFARYVLGNLLTRQLEGVNELLDNLESLLEDKIDRLPTLSDIFVTSHFIGSTPHRVFHPNLNAIYAVHDYKNKNLYLNLLNMQEVVRFDTKNWELCPILADALMDAGCDNQYLLWLLKDNFVYFDRGAWVLHKLMGEL